MTTPFKQTEIGAIPEDWHLTTLGTLLAFTNGLNADKTAYGKGMPFINVMEPITRSHIYGPEIPGRVQITSEAALAYLVKHSDIVFNRTSETDSELGLAAVYLGDERVVFGGFVIRGRPISDALDPKYSGYALRAKTIRSQIISMGQGAIRANIGQQSLQRVLVAVPPKSEQRAIAKALGDVDALIAALDRLIAKKRDIKQATMQQLLTGKTRLPGFSGKWEVKKLGDLGTFHKGSGVKKDEARSGDLPCVRYGEIYTHHNDYVRMFNSWISRGVAETATLLRQGDIMFAGSGETKDEIGKCVAFIDNVEAYAGGDIVILRPTCVDSLFLGYLLNTPEVSSQKASRGQGDAVVHMSSSALASISLSLPQLSEQTAIAAVLSDMDAELSALEARRDKTRALKQGMMQELLTGKTRLI